MGIHESQSLLWERMVALGLPFSKYIIGKVRTFGTPISHVYVTHGSPTARAAVLLLDTLSSVFYQHVHATPQIRKHFPTFPERSPSELHAALNVIKDPSFIRVESDEV